MSSPLNDTAGTPAGARRFRRLRLLVILLGVFVLVAFAAAAAYDVWRSYHHMVTATNREISNVAHALSEQTAWTWKAVDLLLLDTARWYREDARNIPDSDIDSVLAARTAGSQVRLVTIADAHGIQRHRSQGSTPPNLDISDRDHFIAQHQIIDIFRGTQNALLAGETFQFAYIVKAFNLLVYSADGLNVAVLIHRTRHGELLSDRKFR